jgi:hypothetical protein
MDKRQLCGLCAALTLAAAACERPAPPPDLRHPPARGEVWTAPGEAAPGGPRGERYPLLRAPAARTIQVAAPSAAGARGPQAGPQGT